MKQNNKAIKQWSFRDILKDASFYVTLAVSGGIAGFGNEDILRSVIATAGSAMVEMSGALLGIVLAGFAIFLAFMDKKYIALIDRIFGFGNELFPIKVVTILAILCLLFGMGLILLGKPPTPILRLVLFGGLWSYFYLLWQMYELVKWLMGHAKARAVQVQKEVENNGKQ